MNKPYKSHGYSHKLVTPMEVIFEIAICGIALKQGDRATVDKDAMTCKNCIRVKRQREVREYQIALMVKEVREGRELHQVESTFTFSNFRDFIHFIIVKLRRFIPRSA